VAEVAHERVLRGISRWVLVEYLEGLGGSAIREGEGLSLTPDEDFVVGDGWQARLSQLEDYQKGFLRSEQVRLMVTGDPDEVRGMLARLAPRLTRHG
jgi:hypothetical protein